MSIQTELTRLQSAKAAIKTAIEGKGVTVPDATLLNGMASLIESIEAGADLSNIFSGIVATGEYVPASDETGNAIVSFGNAFTKTPVVFVAYESMDSSGGVANRFHSCIMFSKKLKDVSANYPTYCYGGYYDSSKKISPFVFGWNDYVSSEQGFLPFKSTRVGKAGRKYIWIAIGES